MSNVKSHIHTEQGYIALLSAIIISLTLVSMTIMVSSAGFYSRTDGVAYTDKIQSYLLAQGCVEVALGRISSVSSYTPSLSGDVVYIGGDTCRITSVSYETEHPVTREKNILIRTTGQYRNSYTLLSAKVTMKNRNYSYGTPAFEYFSPIEYTEILNP